MKVVFDFVIKQKEAFKSQMVDLKNDYRTAQKLGFNVEVNRIDRDISHTSEIVNLLEDIAFEIQKEKTFTESEISKLQSSVHKITGDGEAMQQYANEFHQTEINKLNKSAVISSVCICGYPNESAGYNTNWKMVCSSCGKPKQTDL